MRRIGPGTARNRCETPGEIRHRHRFPAPENGRQRPGSFGLDRVQPRDERAHVLAGLHAGCGGEPCVSTVGVDEIQKRKRHVFRVAVENLGSRAAGILGAALDRLHAEIAQDSHAAFANDLLSDFVHRRQHTANSERGRVVRHRAVGDREVCFLRHAQTLEMKLKVLDPSRGTAIVRRVDQRLENRPDFGPAFSNGQAQGVRVLVAEDRYIRIVIDGNIVRPPPQ